MVDLEDRGDRRKHAAREPALVLANAGEQAAMRGCTVWLTGLPCSGKSSIAEALVERLRSAGRCAEILDGDAVRTHLSAGLGFSREDRERNVRRIGFVAHLLSRNGVVAVVAVVSPYASTRAEVRTAIGDFVEVYVRCPPEECQRRDVKGMYAQARAGALPGFTGVDAPYEPPPNAELTLDTAHEGVEESAARVWNVLVSLGYLPGSAALSS
jgi:adenylylsulfate kinase